MKKQNNCVCLTCKKSFWTRPSHLRAGEGKYCSQKCMYSSVQWRQKIAECKLGDKNASRRPEVREKIRTFMQGRLVNEKHFAWRGKDVSYSGLHKWIQRKLGKSDICEHCGKSGLTGRQIHWANRSQKYLRDLSDWLRLCVPCHTKYDASFF